MRLVSGGPAPADQPTRHGRCIVAVVVGALALLAACDSGRRGSTLEVFAAASLTDALTEIGSDFRERNPDVDLRFSFAGSASLPAATDRWVRFAVRSNAAQPLPLSNRPPNRPPSR